MKVKLVKAKLAADDFDKMSITEIEQRAETSMYSALDSRKKFIETLFYLETSKRFRENPKYKLATFSEYLYGRYATKVTQYHKERVALISYPEEAERFGVGTVADAFRRCGHSRMPTVFERLEQAKDLTPKTVAQLLNELSPPKPVPQVEPRPTMSELDMLRQENMALHLELKEKNEQIRKLKATIERYRDALAVYEDAVAADAS